MIAGTGLVTDVVTMSAVDGPGNRYVVFLQGCQFDCLACHNPCTIPLRPPWLTPVGVEEVLDGVRLAAPFLSGVTVSGGEAMLQAPFVASLFAALRDDPVTRGLTRFIDSNGDVDAGAWDLVAAVTDGVMVDLKAIDDDIHVVLTGHSNQGVLASISDLAGRGLLDEVRLLLVPGINDSDAVLARTAAWLLAVDAGVRVRVNPFHRSGTRPCARELLEPREEDLARYRAVLVAAGLRDPVIPRS